MLKAYSRLFELLDRSERRQFGQLFGLILVMGLIDVVGVASIFPFLSVLAAPETIQSNTILSKVYDWLGFASTNSFLYFLGGVTLFFVVFGQAFKAFTIYRLTRFARMREYSISSRLLSRYLRQPYAWFLNRHSADLSQIALTEVDKVTQGSLIPALRLLAQGVVILFLVLLLLILQPVTAIVSVIVLGGAYGLIFFSARRYLIRIGVDRLAANNERFRIAQEALGAIKPMKLAGLEESYMEHFRGAARRFSERQAAAAILAELPRYLLEAIVFGGLILMILIMLSNSGQQIDQVIPVLGVFAFAGARIFPALQQVYGGLSTLRFNAPAVDRLIADLRETEEFGAVDIGTGNVGPIALRRAVALKDVSFSYPGASRPVLQNVRIDIAANTTVGIIGSTGAGKTTLVDIILGLLWPDSGAVTVDGIAIDSGNRRAWQKTLGYVPQDIYLADDTIAANIAFGVEKGDVDMDAVVRAGHVAGIHEFVVRDQPDGYQTHIGERGTRLSGGQRQRIGIARALYHDPSLLILDEATSALDNRTERAVMDAVNNLAHRKTIVIIAHRLTTVRACDAILLMKDGRCTVSGTYDDLLARSDEFRAIAVAGA